MPRVVLVHVNVELPDGYPYDEMLAADIADEVRGALEVGTDPEETPALDLATVTVALAEEVTP